MTSLLQEIISVYTLLNPSQLTAAASNRVCNALALLQCVASHNETRALFLNGQLRTRQLAQSDINSSSSHPSLSLSFPEYDLQIPPFRVLTSDLSWSHWRSCQE